MPAPNPGYASFDITTFRHDFAVTRTQRGVTIEDAAIAMNIGTNTLGNFERGAQHGPSLTVFAKLVVWAGLDPNDYIQKE